MTEVQITAELLDELDSAANAATPGPWFDEDSHDSPDHERWVSAKDWSICSTHSGIKGIDSQYPNAVYIAAANPATILALVEHIRSLTEQLGAANEKIDKAWNQPYSSTLDLEGYIPGALDAWKRPVKQHLPYDFSGKPGTDSTQYCNGWNDAGGYWKSHVISLTERLEKAEKDAARYRWLRDQCSTLGRLTIARCTAYEIYGWSGDDPDRAIDTAIAQEADHE